VIASEVSVKSGRKRQIPSMRSLFNMNEIRRKDRGRGVKPDTDIQRIDTDIERIDTAISASYCASG
jgi:hypothetical protein